MKLRHSPHTVRMFINIIIAIVSFVILIAVTASETIVSSPNERDSYIELTEWTLTDEEGHSQNISLPYTLSYKGDCDNYTLTAVLPPVTSSEQNTFRIYPNYMDVDIFVDGEQVYCHHVRDVASFGASGNVFHFFDLPLSDTERVITVKVFCQLGDSTSYFIRPALLGSKTAMYVDDYLRNIPSLFISTAYLLTALVAFISARITSRHFGHASYLYHFGMFVLIFGLYIFLETEYALLLLKNSRFVYMAKFMLLALFVIPLFELVLHSVEKKYRKYAVYSVYLSAFNYVVQFILHFTGTVDFCSMMYVTHFFTFVGSTILITCLALSGSSAFKNIVPLMPMVLGFLADIALLYFGHPSYHNSLWFTVGVSFYILIEVTLIVRQYLNKFHTMIEANTLKTMAYTDMLTGLGNRNAYEKKRMELAAAPGRTSLSCIVADVTGLKQINDTHGHSAGDTALIETAEALRKFMPENGRCYRTGGDEFIALIESSNKNALYAMVDHIREDIARRAESHSLPILLAIGEGIYEKSDESIPEFIRRVDSLMYADKRIQKQKLREKGFVIRD